MKSARGILGVSSIRRSATLAMWALLLLVVPVGAQTDPLPSWNDGPAKKAIVDFVQATTDRDAPLEPREPDISAGTHVYDKAGQRVGGVESVEIADASGRITSITIRQGHLFRTETPIPASMIASAGDRIALNVGADAVKKLERG